MLTDKQWADAALHSAEVALLTAILAVILGTLAAPWAEGTWIAALNTHALRPVGQIFLRLIFMVVVPLVRVLLTFLMPAPTEFLRR